MEICPHCGQSYGLTHSCAGVAPAEDTANWVPPAGFALGYYFRQAIAIARFEDAAILGAARDPRALPYGVLIWLIGACLGFASGVVWAVARGAPLTGNQLGFVALGGMIAVVFTAMLTLAQYGICHGLARWWFGATGSYLGVVRAMLLGSIVTWLVVLPFIGTWAAGIWSIAVLMRVFEEVDEIERMKAFLLAFGTGTLFWILVITFLSGSR